MPAKRPAAADIRAQVHDPLRMTPDESQRLHGKACARCSSGKGLRDSGLAYTASGASGGKPPRMTCEGLPRPSEHGGSQ